MGVIAMTNKGEKAVCEHLAPNAAANGKNLDWGDETETDRNNPMRRWTREAEDIVHGRELEEAAPDGDYRTMVVGSMLHSG